MNIENKYPEDHPSTASWWIHPPGTPESEASRAWWYALSPEERQKATEDFDLMVAKIDEMLKGEIKS